MIHVAILFSLLLALAHSQGTAVKVEPQDIQQFPDDYDSDIYAGYLTVTPSDKSFYYFFFTSQNQQESDPVVLWLNGGPGCSSLMGMVSENGPFLFEKGKKTMKPNPNSWNHNAHILYLESPAGVGFSQGSNKNSSDSSVAEENYIALVNFFTLFPSFKDKDFYIAGESYAGIYIPLLANEIINHNQQESAQQRKINLKGILLGNACTHPTECYTPAYFSRYQVEYLYTRGFLDLPDYSEYRSACIDINETSDPCKAIQLKIKNNFYNSNSNIYNVYDVCYPLKATPEEFIAQEKEKPELGIFRHSLHCSDSIGSMYFFNKNEYRGFFGVQENNTTLSWTPCSDSINYTIQSRASYTFLPGLVQYGLKVWYFSGDFDAMVPIQGTISWLQRYRRDFGAAVRRNWRPWLWEGEKLGGMVWELEGITFYSVIGAGHMVPSDQPEAALHIFHEFIGWHKQQKLSQQ